MRESSIVVRGWRLPSARHRPLAVAVALGLAGCSDVGDSTSVTTPLLDGGDATTVDDASATADASAGDGNESDATSDGAATVTDATAVDARLVDAGHADAGHDATTIDAASLDATADATAADAAEEAEASVPLPDGGCADGDWQCQCDHFIAAHESGNTVGTTCTGSELTLFRVDGDGGCLDCMLGPGQCIDSPSAGTNGQDCEDPYKGAGAAGTTAECLAVVACDVGVDPATADAGAPVQPTGAGPIQGYCGTVAVQACESGNPPANGACKAPIAAGFPSTFSPSQIGGNIAGATYASGRAGAIVGCAQNSCTRCLP